MHDVYGLGAAQIMHGSRAQPAPTAGLGMCDGSNWLDEHTKLLIQRVAGLDGTEVVLTVRDPAAPLRIPQAQVR